MYRKKIKITSFIFLISVFLFLISSKTFAYQKDLFSFSLDWQSFIKSILNKINLINYKSDNVYKEKYYALLKELAEIKMFLKDYKEIDNFSNQIKSYLPHIIEANVLKIDNFGNIYVSNPSINVKEGFLVVDKNLVLIGKIKEVNDNYLVLTSLDKPGIEFSVSDINGDLLGIAKTISNGFIEVNFIDKNFNIKINDFIFTYGDNYYPSNFLVATVDKIESKNTNEKKIIAKLLFDISNNKVYIIVK